MNNHNIGVVGAGIVGMSTALWLQEKGFNVTVFDGSAPGAGTSYGNACTIADYACVPVNNPDIIFNLPKLLFSNNSPLSIDPWYGLTHLPWLIQFLKHCLPNQVSHITQALGAILLHANDGLDPLIQRANGANLLRQFGCLYVYETTERFNAAQKSNQSRTENGVIFEEVDAHEIHDLEPNLKVAFQKGLFFPNARQIINPKHLIDRYFETFIQQQGHYQNQFVTQILEDSNGPEQDKKVSIMLADGTTECLDKVVVCCGAFSNQIPGSGAERLPLDTERGYHIQFADHASLITRPVGWAEAGLYATPTNEGLRLAGTVEIAGTNENKNPKQINYLKRRAKQLFELTQPSSEWLGYRPTFPDALPVIGPSPASNRILLAFGHQHIGLTLAGITGKLIAEIAAGESPSHDITPFSPCRF